MSEQEQVQSEVVEQAQPEVKQKQTAHSGKLHVSSGVARINYDVVFDKDADGRASAGGGGYAFVDIPELLDESLKDNATAQILVKWFDANKNLLPEIAKEI